MILAGIACNCGNPDVISVAPGHTNAEADLFSRVVRLPDPLRAWCSGCWPFMQSDKAEATQ